MRSPLGTFGERVGLKGLRATKQRLADPMTPHLREFLKTDWAAEQLTDALMMRKAVDNKMWRLMREYDLLLVPTLAVRPFENGLQAPARIGVFEVEPFE